MSGNRLSPPAGSKKNRKRVARGSSAGGGQTAGRGNNGYGQRAGAKKRAWFEGGQMPLVRRVPKRGFTPLKRTVYQLVNLERLAGLADTESELTPEAMATKGWIKKADGLVKILGDGEVSRALHIKAHAFSATAKERIEAAGGSVSVIPRHQAETSSAASE